ncbi:hypothetical protein LOTGIDRAFT_238723 [Lottia gigantea]|uniref:C-type lectin domain-containing protein n=1 Tax=Lottia gigantea TaxID=225164 RepID=V4B0M7_LOTGI|nr:hypothetical protein LOTGIDRAFT_238723 [Lottia gigantea]ESO99716.1 hypothetical protein LOTGIDRAFT_238723 [Lottia gigantea]
MAPGGDLDRCPAGLTRSKFLKTFNDRCYQFNHYQVKWHAAQNICRRNGGHLVVIKNAETQNFLMSSLRSLRWRRNGAWIGANDLVSEMNWKWVTGESIGYSYWGSDQPSCKIFRCREDCGILRYSDGGRWHDKPCDNSFYLYSFICQFDMIPTTTTSTTITTTTPTTTTTTTTITTPSTSGTNSTEEMKIVQEDLLKKEAGKSLNKVRGKTTIKTTSTTAKITTTSDRQKYSVVNDPGQQKQHLEDSQERGTGIGTIIALALGLLLGLMVGICFGAVCFIRRRKKKQQHASASFINPYYGEVAREDIDADRFEQSCVVEYKDDVQVGPPVQYDTPPSLSLNNPTYGDVVAVRPVSSDSYDLPKPTPCGLPRDIYQNSNPYENTLPVEENFYEDIDTIKAAIAMNESLDKGEEEDRYVSMPTRNVV